MLQMCLIPRKTVSFELSGSWSLLPLVSTLCLSPVSFGFPGFDAGFGFGLTVTVSVRKESPFWGACVFLAPSCRPHGGQPFCLLLCPPALNVPICQFILSTYCITIFTVNHLKLSLAFRGHIFKMPLLQNSIWLCLNITKSQHKSYHTLQFRV